MILPEEIEEKIQKELEEVLKNCELCWSDRRVPPKYKEKIISAQEPEIRQKYQTRYLNQKYGNAYIGLFYEYLFHYHIGDISTWRNFYFWDDAKDALLGVPELQELAIEKCRVIINYSFMEAVELVEVFGLNEKHLIKIYS